MTTRRDFLSTTAASASLLLTPLKQWASPAAAPGFSLLVMATNWGFQGDWATFCAKAKKEGYDGIEVWWPSEEKDRATLMSALHEYGLQVGFLCGVSDPQFEKHEPRFRAMVEGAVMSKPLYINCHSGRDFFSVEEKSKLIRLTTALSVSSGVPIYHETHRGRALYAAPVARELMAKIPELRLTLDISHWCNVHESLLEDQAETVALALERTDHIHARIGHAEGPQVNDPRAPEWEPAVQAHLAWWDQVVAHKKATGKPMTFLTEFGPPDYLPALPYTRIPVANQWEINVYMLQLLRKRYS